MEITATPATRRTAAAIQADIDGYRDLLAECVAKGHPTATVEARLAERVGEALADGHMTVTCDKWAVGYHTCATMFDGVELNVHRCVDEPNEWGGRGVIVRHEYDGRRFPTQAEAKAYALTIGVTRLFTR